jgi:hypothetical protein
MEQADQTLHDFVLNLLSDSQALASFEQDPAALLDHAGLSDISAADIKDVLPLVIDYVPAHAEVLDAALSQLPLDSVDTGQLGAIQQLQFVTQALGGLPAFDKAGVFGNADGVSGEYHVISDGQGGVFGMTGVQTPFSASDMSLGRDAHGVNATLFEHSPAGTLAANIEIPGLHSGPTLGGGLPGFSALSDVTDALDGHVGPLTTTVTTNLNNAANMLAGASDLAAGAIAAPTAELAGALADPTGTVSALAGTAEQYAAYGVSGLPAPANQVAGQVVHTATVTTQGAVSEVTSHLPAHLGVGDVTGQLQGLDPTHALSSVQGVVTQVTGDLGTHLPTGAITDLTSHVPSLDPTQAAHTLQAGAAAVQSTVGDIASHSAVADVTSTTGAGSALGSVDHNDVTSDLGHVASDLHLPSLF